MSAIDEKNSPAAAAVSPEVVLAAQALINNKGANCYSVNVERKGCQILLKRRINKSTFQTVGRISVEHEGRAAAEEALCRAFGWWNGQSWQKAVEDKVHVG